MKSLKALLHRWRVRRALRVLRRTRFVDAKGNASVLEPVRVADCFSLATGDEEVNP